MKDVSHVVPVTNREYYFLTKDECAGWEGLSHAFLLAPAGRNTAPAIAMAAFYIAGKHGADATLLVLPADHFIEDLATFASAVETARELARKGSLVTFAILPTRPETGYGHIECVEPVDQNGSRNVARFIEKPAQELAERLIATGNCLWNSGIFYFGAEAFFRALKSCDGALYEKALASWNATPASSDDRISLDPESFSRMPDISVDYAVMEKHPDVVVVKAGFDWNDIGSWNALGELSPVDSRGNLTQGESVLMGVGNCYIQSDSRIVAAVGEDDLVVVDTPDALLVANRQRVQDMSQVVQHLKLANHSAHLLHRTVYRPWGTYTVLEEGPGYKLKRIVVKPGAALSMQMHKHRSERWVVISGTAKDTNGGEELDVPPNEPTFIPVGEKHRRSSLGTEDLVIIEVQAGDYLGEDDIVRFDDVYGRTWRAPAESGRCRASYVRNRISACPRTATSR